MLSGDFHSSDLCFNPSPPAQVLSDSCLSIWLLLSDPDLSMLGSGLNTLILFLSWLFCPPWISWYPSECPLQILKIAGILCLCLMAESPPCWRGLHVSIYGTNQTQAEPSFWSLSSRLAHPHVPSQLYNIPCPAWRSRPEGNFSCEWMWECKCKTKEVRLWMHSVMEELNSVSISAVRTAYSFF